jgi:hypothetical protein
LAYFSSTPGQALARRRPVRLLGGPPAPSRPVHLEHARLAIDADPVSVAQQGNRPACGRLGSDVADHQAARRPGKATVGDERDLLAHALAVDQRR